MVDCSKRDENYRFPSSVTYIFPRVKERRLHNLERMLTFPTDPWNFLANPGNARKANKHAKGGSKCETLDPPCKIYKILNIVIVK